MTDKISPDEAKQLIDDAPFGFLVVGAIEPIPALGDVSAEDSRVKISAHSYQFEDMG